jgi:hypothetical protein
MQHMKLRPLPAARVARLTAGGLVLALSLAACTKEPPPPPCPAVVPVTDAAQMVRFNGAGHDLTDVVFEARIQDYALICEYDEGVIDGKMMLSVLAVRGPANQDQVARVGYFVAVATRDQQVAAREEFNLEIPFEGNRNRVVAVDEVVPRIPLKAGEDGNNYVIYIGLIVTPEELQYNRQNR